MKRLAPTVATKACISCLRPCCFTCPPPLSLFRWNTKLLCRRLGPLLPFNLGMLCYVLTTARLMEVNLGVGTALVFIAWVAVAGLLSWVCAGLVSWLIPGSLETKQVGLVVGMTVLVVAVFTLLMPMVTPRIQRFVQTTFAQERYRYHLAMEAVIRKAAAMPRSEELLQFVAEQVCDHMKLTCVSIFTQAALEQGFILRVAVPASVAENIPHAVRSDSAVVQWLQQQRHTMVADELRVREDQHVLEPILREMDQLQAAACVPLLIEHQFVGILAVGEKPRRSIFDQLDIEVLESLAFETALALKYRQMEEEILLRRTLTELGTIAAGVAHEIRNPLASIKTFAQLLPAKADDPEFRNEFSRLVVMDVERITKVVETMLAFARPAEVKVANYSAAELVEEAVLLVQSRLKSKSIELTKQFHEQPVLRVDKQQILQVLVNLLNNAVDALPEHGKIRVATGVRTMEDAEEGNGSQRCGVIEVADNGPGMPAAIRNRLFDPFFTTKREGTGLGLSISQKIVRDHGGIITVSSIEGKGTTFQVNLPLI